MCLLPSWDIERSWLRNVLLGVHTSERPACLSAGRNGALRGSGSCMRRVGSFRETGSGGLGWARKLAGLPKPALSPSSHTIAFLIPH